MANPFRGEVTITIGGEERTLSYTFNSLCALQKRLGKSVQACIAAGTFEEAELRESLAAGLGEPADRVGEWMGETPEHTGDWFSAVTGAVMIAHLGPKPSKEKLEKSRPLLKKLGVRHPADKAETTPPSPTTENSSGPPAAQG